ncbi:MAG: hypothetical protein ACR2JA_18240 [Hydrogenophaga sp.]|uniref:hypothetical protein n=1 Tax=Hydrogenophaga sp. TaxID=1904254 RepID=UPI003D9BA5B2
MNRVLPSVSIAAFVIGLAGCSTQAWYESVRMGAESQCTRQPPGADRACRDRVNQKTYDEYEQERSDLRK